MPHHDPVTHNGVASGDEGGKVSAGVDDAEMGVLVVVAFGVVHVARPRHEQQALLLWGFGWLVLNVLQRPTGALTCRCHKLRRCLHDRKREKEEDSLKTKPARNLKAPTFIRMTRQRHHESRSKHYGSSAAPIQLAPYSSHPVQRALQRRQK